MSPFCPCRRAALAAALTLALLSGATPLRADDRPNAAPIEALLLDFDRVRIEPAEAAARVRSGGRLSIETPRASFDVALQPHDLRAPNYRAQVTHGGGVEAVETGPVHTYRGTVRGMEGAEARFTITDEGVTGLIVADDTWYYVEPERAFSKAAAPASHVVYSSLDVRAGALGSCGTTLAQVVGTPDAPPLAPTRGTGGEIPPVLELATEADFEYFEFFGGAREANREILSILNQVEGVYKKQLGVAFRVVFQNVWGTRRDPYETDEAEELLSELRTYWNVNNGDVERDLTHMWTGREIFGSTIGIAYVGVACASPSASYGLSERMPSGPGKFILTGHEIGHNFSAVHPDQLDTPVAACDNTIMQSSVGTGFKFCKYSRTQITTWLSRFSNCLRNNHAPAAVAGLDRFAGRGDTVTLYGVGSQDLDGDALSYRWAQTSGPAVTLSGSASASPSFTVPEVSDETPLTFELTVEDGRDGVGKDSIVVTVLPEALPGAAVTAPAAGASVKVGAKLGVRWAADPGLEGTLRVELSRDGGATFEPLFAGVAASAGKRKWVATGPKTTAAVIRVTSESDTRSQRFSPAFTIR
jgi:hypothetical protein